MTVAIQFERDSLNQSRRGSITGVVYIASDGACFPEEGWSDFVVVVAIWWLRGLRDIGSESVYMDFMDGPFRLKVCAPGALA